MSSEKVDKASKAFKPSMPENTNVSSQFQGPVTIQAEHIHFGVGDISGVQNINPQQNLNSLEQNTAKMQLSSTSGSNQPDKVLSDAALARLIDLSDSYVNNEKYHKALEVLQTIRVQQKGQNQISTLLKIVQCQVETELLEDALNSLDQLESAVNSAEYQSLPTHVVDDCCDGFKNLVTKFIEIKMLKTAVSLQRTLLLLIKKFFEGESRADHLSDLGLPMQDIATELQSQNKSNQFKSYYGFMDQILNELQDINDVDLQFKCNQITWFLKYYSYCCDEIMDHKQSVALSSQAIFGMKLVFANNASNYHVYGHCHHVIAVAYESLNQLKKSLIYYKKAHAIYKEATDWESDDEKETNISLASNNLQGVENKLKEK